MDKLELAWDTYDFHTAIVYDLEEKHKLVIDSYDKFVKKNLNPSHTKRIYGTENIITGTRTVRR